MIEPPAFASARTPLIYDGAVRKLALDLKHAARRDGLQLFGQRMAAAAGPAVAKAGMIVPVPLHWTRLAQRGFNQAGWLAAALARQAGKPMRHNVLTRHKRRRSQEGLTRKQRLANAAGAYRATVEVAGRAILVVDDVFTTGATVNARARALLTAGAGRADVVTLARVVRPFIDIT